MSSAFFSDLLSQLLPLLLTLILELMGVGGGSLS